MEFSDCVFDILAGMPMVMLLPAIVLGLNETSVFARCATPPNALIRSYLIVALEVGVVVSCGTQLLSGSALEKLLVTQGVQERGRARQ